MRRCPTFGIPVPCDPTADCASCRVDYNERAAIATDSDQPRDVAERLARDWLLARVRATAKGQRDLL